MRLRVLVVDDNADAAETIGMLLSHWGHDTGISLHLVKPVEPPLLQKLLSSLGEARGGGDR